MLQAVSLWRCAQPLYKGTAKAFLAGKATGQGNAFEWYVAAQQQRAGTLATHLVLELLHRGARLLQLPVQTAWGQVQQRGQAVGGVSALGGGGDGLAHALHQVMAGAVGAHLNG